MRIVVFADNFSPSEHLLGLLIIAVQTNNLEKMYVFGKLPDRVEDDWIREFQGKLVHKSDASYFAKMKAIVASDIVFGISFAFLWMRVLSRLRILSFRPFFLGPGFVTKAVGYFKHPERGRWPAIKTMLTFDFLNTYFICSNELDRLYLAAALGYPLNRTVSSPLPKHVYINDALKRGDKKAIRNAILFAPTHRWDEVIPPLTKLMADTDFVSGLIKRGFDIFHSKHPDTTETILDLRVHKFEKDWSRVSCVVTDYSSIGEDFMLSGGGNVILYVPDKLEFEAHQGFGPLFDDSMNEKIVTRELVELNTALDELAGGMTANSVHEILVDDYFQRLLAIGARQ